MAFALAIAVIGWVASESFLNPTDARVYLSAGERLLAGHQLYALGPGDRDVLLNPPYWTVPFLAPPLMGIASMPLALLGDSGIAAGWAIAAVGYLGALAVLVRGAPIWGALGAAVLAPQIGAQLAIGNVNGLLALGLLGAWLLRDRAWLVGLILAVMIAVKVTPIVLMLWLVVTGRYRAAAATIVCSLVLLAASVAVAGLDAHLEYLRVATDTIGDGTTNASIAGLTRELGASPEIARVVPWIIIVAGALVSIRWRKVLGVAFAVSVVLMTVGSPSFNPYWFALTLFALVPYAIGRRVEAT